MVKPTTKQGKGTTALPLVNPVGIWLMPQKAKPTPEHKEWPLAKNLLLHILSLLAHTVLCQNQ